jgi:acetyl esterase/lipase
MNSILSAIVFPSGRCSPAQIPVRRHPAPAPARPGAGRPVRSSRAQSGPRFWDQYTTDPDQRAEITASPLRATASDLAGLPPALVINGEADVLRDEGEAYAAHLRAAGVPVTSVRYNGTIHDFVMLNALRDTHAAKAATAQGGEFLRALLWDAKA